MTYTPIQLEVIKVFGRKELSEGCIIYIIEDDDYCEITYRDDFFYTTDYEGNKEQIGNFDASETDKYEILGHIPHLEDVFRVAKKKENMCIQAGDTSGINVGLSIRTDKMRIHKLVYLQSIPLIEQPESVLIELLNLFK